MGQEIPIKNTMHAFTNELNVSKIWVFSFSPLTSQLTQLYEYLAIDSGGNVSDLVVARNCCMTRMLP